MVMRKFITELIVTSLEIFVLIAITVPVATVLIWYSIKSDSSLTLLTLYILIAFMFYPTSVKVVRWFVKLWKIK